MSNKFSNPVDINGRTITSLRAWKAKNPKSLFFDSKFEWECFKLLEKECFNYNFHPESRVVMEGFSTIALSKGRDARKLFKSVVRPITYTPDFAIYCNDGTVIFVEAKGFFHKDARLRYKLFQSSLKKNEISLLAYDKQDGLRDMKAIIRLVNEEFGGSTIGKKKQENKCSITTI